MMDEKRKPLIAGIDPGMRADYSLPDVSGNFVASSSAKELSLPELMQEIHSRGKLIAVSTDKEKKSTKNHISLL